MAIQSVREDLHCDKKLNPYTIGAVARLSEFPKAKSPGLPWKLRGYKSKGDVVAEPDNVLKVGDEVIISLPLVSIIPAV
jgi:hypothetical protein